MPEMSTLREELLSNIDLNSIDHEILFNDTFLQKIITTSKSCVYMMIIETFKLTRPLEPISNLINIPLYNKRFDIISSMLSKNIDVFEADVWNYSQFCELFFTKSNRNVNKIMLRLLNKFSVSIGINENKRTAILYGLVKNNQTKYIDHIIAQYEAGNDIIYFIIETVTTATIFYQNLSILESKLFNTSRFLYDPKVIIKSLFEIKTDLCYIFAYNFLKKFRSIWNNILNIRTEYTSIYDILGIVHGGHGIIKEMEESQSEDYDYSGMFDILSTNGWTPLHNSARWGTYDTFEFLFNRYNEKSVMYSEPYSRSYNVKHNLLSLGLRNKDKAVVTHILENIDNTFLWYWSKFDDIMYAFLYSVWIPPLERIKRFEYLIDTFLNRENIVLHSMTSTFISKLCKCTWNEDSTIECGILKYTIHKAKHLSQNSMKKILRKVRHISKTKKLDIINLVLIKVKSKGDHLKYSILRNILLYIPWTELDIFPEINKLETKYRNCLYLQILFI